MLGYLLSKDASLNQQRVLRASSFLDCLCCVKSQGTPFTESCWLQQRSELSLKVAVAVDPHKHRINTKISLMVLLGLHVCMTSGRSPLGRSLADG